MEYFYMGLQCKNIPYFCTAVYMYEHSLHSNVHLYCFNSSYFAFVPGGMAALGVFVIISTIVKCMKTSSQGDIYPQGAHNNIQFSTDYTSVSRQYIYRRVVTRSTGQNSVSR